MRQRRKPYGLPFDGPIRIVFSGVNSYTEEIVASSKNGFPWQASIEAEPKAVEDVQAGAQAQVNGQPVSGPITVIRKSRLKGASFVSLGADASTGVRVAASQGGKAMDPKFREWLIAKGFDKPEALTEAQVASLKASYDAELVKAAAGDGKAPAPAPAKVPEPVKAADPAELIKAERQRVSQIEAACKGDWSKEDAVKVEAIRTTGIAAGQTLAEVNAELLKVLRASRPAASAPAFIQGGSQPVTAQILAAALCMANRAKVGMDDAKLVASFGQQTIEAAHRLARVRLTEIMAACAELDGITLPRFGRGSDEWIRAAFSSISLAGILGNTANKTLLAAYAAVPSGIRRIFKTGQVSDFKTHTRYRLTADGVMKKVAPSGEIQHGTLGEDSYTQKVDTYGRFFQLTRQDVVNDDLGAFLEIPRVLGRGWAVAIEEAGATLLLSNPSSFFSGANANYNSGAGSVLGNTGLATLVALFLAQVDSQGKSVMVEPRYLVVPPALKNTADQLYVSSNLDTVASGLSSTAARVVEQVPNRNTHAGKYEPICIPQLSNASFSGYSALAWYLFADPAALAAFEIAYLNGQEMPTIESVGVATDVLGLGFRGYGDFGVAAQDHRGAAMSAGS